MTKIVYVLSKEAADELVACGFSYVQTERAGMTVYQFVEHPDLMWRLENYYPKRVYCTDKLLRFESGCSAC